MSRTRAKIECVVEKKRFSPLIRLDLYREQAPAPIHSMPGKQKNRDLEDALTVSQAIGSLVPGD